MSEDGRAVCLTAGMRFMPHSGPLQRRSAPRPLRDRGRILSREKWLNRRANFAQTMPIGAERTRPLPQ